MLPIDLIKIRNKFIVFKFSPVIPENIGFCCWTFEKKSLKKINCRKWSENVDITLPDSISSKEVVKFEKIVSINMEVLDIFVGNNI